MGSPSSYLPSYTPARPPWVGAPGQIIIPIWLPFGLFGFPAVFLWRREFVQWRRATDAGRIKIVREGFSRPASAIMAGLSIPFTLVLAPLLLQALDHLTGQWIAHIADVAMSTSATAWLCGLFFCWFLAAYSVAKFVYRRARQVTCYIDAPFCPR